MTMNWENPILTKELRTRMRGAKAFWILLLYLGLLSVILGGTYLSWLVGQERQGAYATQTYDMGRMFYGVIFAVQAALVGLITPALTAGALSIEREQRTFEALAVSPLSRRSIVLGKLTSSVGFVGLLIPHLTRGLLGATGRYNLLVYNSDKVVLRRVVARHQDGWSEEDQVVASFLEPVELGTGDTVKVTCYWDNSASNPNQRNDPPVDVEFGEHTDDEMCFGFTYVAL